MAIMQNEKLDTLYRALQSVFVHHPTLVVAGASFGDEGKGKVIDAVMRSYDIVARYSGGANAGHTVKTDEGVTVVSHLIPCGLAQRKTCVMGPGEFFDARLFLKEKQEAAHLLGDVSDILVDPMCALWTPYHGLLESYIESLRGKDIIGTTGKGIAPLEALFKLRVSPVVGHLFANRDELVKILGLLHCVLQPLFNEMLAQQLVKEMPNPSQVAEELLGLAADIKPHIKDTSFWLSQGLAEGKRVLFEGAQATGLDARFGTYPYVSAGQSIAAGASVGTGLPMQAFSATLLVAKILPTRVGAGPFPSEMWERDAAESYAKEHSAYFTDKSKKQVFLAEALGKINAGTASRPEWSQYFQVLGDERGATTGRGRSVGFPDIPWLQYACRINGPQWLAITRFDMLSGLRSIPVVVGYKLDGTLLRPGEMPPPWRLADVEAVFEQWECWSENIYGTGREADLPQAAKVFLQRLEERIGTKILLVGTGPERDALIVRT